VKSYSKKLIHKIEHPRSVGFFTEEEAKMKAMRLAIGKEGTLQEGNALAFYLLIDESDGVIADAKFQAFGAPALIGAAEVACELLLRRTYDQARRLTAELIDKQVRDKQEISAFPEWTLSHLNRVLFAIEEAAMQCMDIPIEDVFIPTPVTTDEFTEARVYPGWETLGTQHRIAVIESVIATEIRPYIELDAGGVHIIDLLNGNEVIIAYEGACTTCHSATGSTLSAIQHILKNKIHPDLFVTPELPTH
jgi:NifU-like protein